MEGKPYYNYVVYPDGSVWSNYTRMFLTPQDNGTGYMKLFLRIDGKPKNVYVHRLVAQCFIPNPNGLSEINHIDGDKKNNAVSNLEWCTCLQNKKHAVENGLVRHGEAKLEHKLTEEQVTAIRNEYIYGSHEKGQRGLAKKYNVSQTAIRYILTGRNWGYCFGN